MWRKRNYSNVILINIQEEWKNLFLLNCKVFFSFFDHSLFSSILTSTMHSFLPVLFTNFFPFHLLLLGESNLSAFMYILYLIPSFLFFFLKFFFFLNSFAPLPSLYLAHLFPLSLYLFLPHTRVLLCFTCTVSMPISSPPQTYLLDPTGTSGLPVGPDICIGNFYFLLNIC